MLLNGFQLPNNKFLEFAPIKAEAQTLKMFQKPPTIQTQ